MLESTHSSSPQIRIFVHKLKFWFSKHKNHVIINYTICFPQKVLNVTFFYQEKLSKVINLLPKSAIIVYGSKICYLWADINLLNEYKYSFSWYSRGEGVFFKVKGGGAKKIWGRK
jgi:hypothetical protein